jgi:hypothetical protein
MKSNILAGKGRSFSEMPWAEWELQLAQAPQRISALLTFMTEAHHKVRNFVVRELPRTGKPIPPETLSEALDLPMPRVAEILDDLEKHLFFLVRNEKGAVSWAFPVTVDKTPHRLAFSTGERLNAA